MRGGMEAWMSHTPVNKIGTELQQSGWNATSAEVPVWLFQTRLAERMVIGRSSSCSNIQKEILFSLCHSSSRNQHRASKFRRAVPR